MWFTHTHICRIHSIPALNIIYECTLLIQPRLPHPLFGCGSNPHSYIPRVIVKLVTPGLLFFEQTITELSKAISKTVTRGIKVLLAMAWWRIWDSNHGDGQPKTLHAVLGYFFLVNYCIGTGFLGIPYAFFYSGYLAAIPTLAFTAFSAWVSARWLIEIMSRAQVKTLFF